MYIAPCIIRLALVLSTLAAAVHGHILSTTLAKAIAGEWVGLEGSKDESMIKIIKAKKLTWNGRLSFETAEDYCRREGAHLLSIRNKDEQEFVAELVLKVRNSEAEDYAVNIVTGAKAQYITWLDGSPVDYIQKQVSEDERRCYHLYAVSKPRTEVWLGFTCTDIPITGSTYVVCMT